MSIYMKVMLTVQQVITKPATAEKEDYEVGRKIAA